MYGNLLLSLINTAQRKEYIRDFIPHKFIIWLFVIVMINLAAMVGYANPIAGDKYWSLYPLLNWHDPVSAVPIEQQLDTLWHSDVFVFGGPDVYAIPPEVKYLTNVRTFFISDTNVMEVPSEISLLPNLERLYIATTPLKRLPPEIANLPKLQELNLLVTGLQSLPPEVKILCEKIRCIVF